MKLHVILAAASGCDPKLLDDAARMEALLRAMVDAGGFTLFGVRVHKFEPQGVTGAAIVGESHLCVHTWPEEGRLFVDIASCTTREHGLRALEPVRRAFPNAVLTVSETEYTDAGGFRPSRS